MVLGLLELRCPMVPAVLGLLAVLAVLAGRGFLVGLGVLEVLELGFHLRVPAVLEILAGRWVLVGLGVLAVLLGMGGMERVRRSGTPPGLGVLGLLALRGSRGCLAVLEILVGQELLVRLRSSTPSTIRRRPNGQFGCARRGWS
jgi:hypothetical protein